jgi:hypothetical protein
MKKLIVLFALVIAGTGLQAQADAIDTFFKQYLDDPRFSVIYIGPRLFQMFGDMELDGVEFDDEEEEAVLEIAKGLKGLRILTAEEDIDGLYEEAMRKIDTSGYEILMKIRDNDGSNLDFFIKENGDNKISELFMIAGGDGEDFVLMSFVGNMSIDEVTKMAKGIKNKNRN